MKVLAAMSGGVDSSVAAARMANEGHEVIGITLKLWEEPDGTAPTAGCCTLADSEDARRVAAQLQIPYYVLDYTDQFRSGVVDHFVSEYASGRTPNPCIECNRVVKFDLLLDRASELGCEMVVTGHYARTRRTAAGIQLLRAVDTEKDQSYVLYMLGQEALGRVRFPVGDLTKAETRAEAARLELRTAEKRDSQDVCFVGRGNYRSFLRRHAPTMTDPGLIVDIDGAVLGEHAGISNFTVGQRRGVGVALAEPRYVVELRPEDRQVVVGTKDSLLARGCRVSGFSWVSGSPPPFDDVEVKLRYRAHPQRARLASLTGEGVAEIRFQEPQPAVTPGQAAVVYRGDRVLGGGTIDSAVR
ncbi:MAG: tRNA 2-thiouridine(34) synthase MnmA [Acidimicrobiia bacterium]